MLAGPAALLIALCLIPGWVFWRFEGSPRSARSSIAEMFEVIAASALSLGLSALAYLTVESRWQTPLLDPAALTTDHGLDDAVRVAWSGAALLALGCLVAWLGATSRRRWRTRATQHLASYRAEEPFWFAALGGQPASVVTIDLKNGKRCTGYLGRYDVTNDATPSLELLPPVLIESAPARGGFRAKPAEASEYREHNLIVPGSEISAVWTANKE